MEVYIEDVIFDNLIIDFLILLISGKILHIDTKILRLTLSAMVGVGFTILNLFLPLEGVALMFYKLGLGLLMCIIAFGERTIKRTILSYLTFLFVTLLMGGACFGLCFTFGKVVLGEGGEFAYSLALPVGVVVGVIALISFLLFQLVEVIKHRAKRTNFVFDATIYNDNRSLKLKAFLDTGNTLFDPETNKPVIIITYDYFKKLNKEAQLYELLLNRVPKGIKNAHFISVNSVGKTSKMLIFTMDMIKITQNKFTYFADDAVFGVTFAKIEKNLNCQMLISEELLTGGYY